MVERSDTFRICERKEAGTPAGVQDLMSRLRPVVSSLALLNHRLQAVMPPESSRSKSANHDREAFKRAQPRPQNLERKARFWGIKKRLTPKAARYPVSANSQAQSGTKFQIHGSNPWLGQA